MPPSTIAQRAQELIAGLSEIPVEELVRCARENLQATRTVRISRGAINPETGERMPDTVAEPDYQVRQKALEWISAQRAGAPAQRKAVDAPKAETLNEEQPRAGKLKGY